MADYILVDGDLVIFNPAFGPAVVVVQPTTLRGSGEALLTGKKVCIEGDEKNVSVPGCPYTSGSFTIPGIGTLKINSLGSDQTAQKTISAGKPVLLKGSTFTAIFEVQTPAQQPAVPSPIPDVMVQYPGGSGMFQTTNIKWLGA